MKTANLMNGPFCYFLHVVTHRIEEKIYKLKSCIMKLYNKTAKLHCNNKKNKNRCVRYP